MHCSSLFAPFLACVVPSFYSIFYCILCFVPCLRLCLRKVAQVSLSAAEHPGHLISHTFPPHFALFVPTLSSSCLAFFFTVTITVSFLCIFGLDCSVINLARATSSTDLTAQWLRRDSYIFLSHFIPFYTPPSGTRQTPTTVPHLLAPLPCTIPGALNLPSPPSPLHAAPHPRATCLSDACIVTLPEALVFDKVPS